ncbi:uncharacterized protein N7484_005987 [Penicillium longicatenatum]|uniref:uncharacterized protein n=1 Tax=Penicillium longicatenatum TaxID=1561947 RepID=UPI0025467D44|nr:uncharacterized protein N7484_005987 [Penicillium longicatenatum]KAJ5643480.1 hypothetical protein N7484_005987 [Penicillium longicatenatum]
MPPALYLVRHGQGEHNLHDSHHLRDAHLTDTGKNQCRDLRDSFLYHDDLSLILASPLRRTIQTAAHAFHPALEKRQIPFVLAPKAQEISKRPCDVGLIVMFSWLRYQLTGGWLGNSKKDLYVPTTGAVRRRAAQLRVWLWQLPHEHVLLVSHGSFLHYLTEDWSFYATAYRNCEYRRFTFTEDSTESEAYLLEVGRTSAKIGRPLGVDADLLLDLQEVEGVS